MRKHFRSPYRKAVPMRAVQQERLPDRRPGKLSIERARRHEPASARSDPDYSQADLERRKAVEAKATLAHICPAVQSVGAFPMPV